MRSSPAFLGLGLCVLASYGVGAVCPKGLDPYMAEASPFGWPIAPNEWDYSHSECWAEKYELCGGERQSPMDLNFQLPGAECVPEVVGAQGLLAEKARYQIVAGQPLVTISKYMRSAAVAGDFGTLVLKDPRGHDVEFEAVQLHLTAGSLHTINGQAADAELLVVHRPKGVADPFAGSVVLSVLFRQSETSSDLFSQMGFDTELLEGAKWIAPNSVDLPSAVRSALRGTSYSYSGSVPVPPCSENVHYVVLAAEQPVGAAQIENLKNLLLREAGGYHKRPPAPRTGTDGVCRNVAGNSLEVAEAKQGCAKASERSASCWTETCDKSPVDIDPWQADRAGGPQDPSELLRYKPVGHVTMTPSMYTLDALGDFGHIIVNGRLFEARKMSIKAISQHTFNGTRYAGELVVEHSLFGDDLAALLRHSSFAHRRLESDKDADEDGGRSPRSISHGGVTPNEEDTATSKDADEDSSKRPRSISHGGVAPNEEEDSAPNGSKATQRPKTTSVQPGGPHRVMLSVPLTLGRESALLRSLGLGEPTRQTAIRDGNAYEVHGPVDLAAALQPALSKHWYWYTGGPTGPGSCPAWGVKWLVFEEPLEVSLEQLNSLALQVSGVDSTVPPQRIDPKTIAKAHVPESGLEAGDCALGDLYDHPSCWTTANPVCGSGQAQSPINIEPSLVAEVGNASFLAQTSWKPISGLRLSNTGFNLGFETNQLGYVTLVGASGFPKYYQVTSVALHMPSEHLINGKQFPAELQILHKNQKTVLELDDQDMLITSFLFDLGEESKLLKQLLPAQLPAIGAAVPVERPVDLLWALGPSLGGPFYKYDGSHTTPSCAEVVQWAVFETPFTLSLEQWQAFEVAFPSPSNNRPVQPLNGRRIVKNTMAEPKPANFQLFLSRDFAHNRRQPAPSLVIVPILGTLALCAIVMTATLQREDAHRKEEGAGGLVEEKAMMIGRGDF